jgi:hypothetical protein
MVRVVGLLFLARFAAPQSGAASFSICANTLRPYVLVGDMNEDIYRPRTYEQGAIQTLTSMPTGLRLTTPRNPVTAADRTWSIQNASLTIRFDYVLPCGLLYSNITSSQVFRSDRGSAASAGRPAATPVSTANPSSSNNTKGRVTSIGLLIRPIAKKSNARPYALPQRPILGLRTSFGLRVSTFELPHVGASPGIDNLTQSKQPGTKPDYPDMVVKWLGAHETH